MLNELKLIVTHKKKVKLKIKIILIEYLMNLYLSFKILCKYYYVNELLLEVCIKK